MLRQYPLYSKTEPPALLAEHFTPEVFNKSQKYGKHKAKFSLVSGLYRQVLDTVQIQSGLFYPWAWKAAGQVIGYFNYGPEYQITQSLVFVIVLTLISTVPTLPLNVYQTFVLEEQHGFNKVTPTLFVTDMLKGWAVGFTLGLPLLAAFLYVFEWAGDRFIPWLMALLLTFQITMVLIYPTLIQPLFNKLSPLSEGDLRKRIEALAGKLNFPLKHLYEIDGSKRSSHSNAYFFGLPWSKHIVIFDTLINQAAPSEVEAVLAHELGHWYHAHPTKLLLISQFHLLSILVLFPAFQHSSPLLRSFGFPPEVASSPFNGGKPPSVLAFLLFQMVLSPMECVVGMGMNAVSRMFEYEADVFAWGIGDLLASKGVISEEEAHAPSTIKAVPEPSTDAVPVETDKDANGKAEGGEGMGMGDMGKRLGRALVKLHVENLSTVWVDWLYSAYHHSHPTLTERLRALEKMDETREKERRGRERKEL